MRALDDESGDYEHSMLGSIEFDRSLCSFDFDICSDCKGQEFLVPDRCCGIDGVCKSCGYDIDPMSEYEREMLSADLDDDESDLSTASGRRPPTPLTRQAIAETRWTRSSRRRDSAIPRSTSA